MTKETPKQKAIVERVMHDFKAGDLKANGGRKVKTPRQAIAIALHEAGVARDQTPPKKT